MKSDVIIVGAGLAGLACAIPLQQAGMQVMVLESEDVVGGRVRTDPCEGFLLDRGFQVLLTGYEEARAVLDLGALDLRAFDPGALVRARGRFHTVADPVRRPDAILSTLLAPVGTIADKWRMRGLAAELKRMAASEVWQRPERTTREALEARGFSPAMIETFFRPFFGGVFFDPSLATSSRMFEFCFRHFAGAAATVPARGMQQIPEQLLARIEPGTVHLGRRVESRTKTAVRTIDGATYEASAVVVATDATEAGRLAPNLPVPGWRGVTTLYYAADQAPVPDPILVLNGDDEGPINNLHVPSNLSRDVAPDGSALVSVTVVEDGGQEGDALEARVRTQLSRWFGAGVDGWRLLRTYRIPYALPNQAPPALASMPRPARLADGTYVAGDHRTHASIDGALLSGRLAAEAIRVDLQR